MIDHRFSLSCCGRDAVTRVFGFKSFRFETDCPYGCPGSSLYTIGEWKPLKYREGHRQAAARLACRVPGTPGPGDPLPPGGEVSRPGTCGHDHAPLLSVAGLAVCSNCGGLYGEAKGYQRQADGVTS